MPARDTFHDIVVEALLKEGWTITHDPFRLRFEGTSLYADLGAERSIGAERGHEKILVEIKSFVGVSDIAALVNAIGQYQLYKILLEGVERERTPYLAIPSEAYQSTLDHPTGQSLIEKLGLKLCVYSIVDREIERWLP